MIATHAPAVPEGLAAPRYAVLSIAAAIVTIGLKLAAWKMTGSVGLFSDAVESVINLVAAAAALWALHVAARPADADHPYGHTKAEYLSSGFEGLLIVGAAVIIAETAWGRLADPQPLSQVWLGLGVSTLASLVNGGVAWVLFGAGRRLDSITLRADAHHLMADVWTSVGVLIGVALVKLTGWHVLDPLVAFVVATNIVYTGGKLLVESANGLLDRSVPGHEQETMDGVLARFRARGVAIDGVRARLAGRERFAEMNVRVPGDWSVKQGHDLCEEIEAELKAALPRTTVLTHLEPFEERG